MFVEAISTAGRFDERDCALTSGAEIVIKTTSSRRGLRSELSSIRHMEAVWISDDHAFSIDVRHRPHGMAGDEPAAAQAH